MVEAKSKYMLVQPHLEVVSRTRTVLCGSDKSLTHRAIMLGSLANGTSTVRFPLLGEDCLATIECFRALGVKIDLAKDSDGVTQLVITSGGRQSFSSPEAPLNCANSGTTARLLTGILAGIDGLQVTLTGDPSLSLRPMARVTTPLIRAGARIEFSQSEGHLPLTIKGSSLQCVAHDVEVASAQVKSALLLAALGAKGETRVTIPAGTRNHTEVMLKNLGLQILISKEGGKEVIKLTGPFDPPAHDYCIPVDPSSAAFFVVLGAITPTGTTVLPRVLENQTRTGFLRVLDRMTPGTILGEEEPDNIDFIEPAMRISIRGGSTLKGTTIQAEEIPSLIDEIPILAVAAAFATGPSCFFGLGELRVKESDRLIKTAELLKLAGASVSIERDNLVIFGGLHSAKPFDFDPAGDHRLAMAAAIMATRSAGACRIKDPECVAVSFPDFFRKLAAFESSNSQG